MSPDKAVVMTGGDNINVVNIWKLYDDPTPHIDQVGV